MAGAAADDEQVDIVELLEHSGLTAVDQRRVHNDALVNNMIDGWTPDRQSILRLIEFAAGRIDDDEHKRTSTESRGARDAGQATNGLNDYSGQSACEGSLTRSPSHVPSVGRETSQ